jgi:integrase
LRPFLDCDPEAYLFSPREAVEGYLQKNGRRIRHARSRRPGEHYTVTSYDRAIANACRRAGVPPWAPNQLRHTKATEVRREAGLDAARALLGHRSTATTGVYTEIDVSKAADVMERLG